MRFAMPGSSMPDGRIEYPEYVINVSSEARESAKSTGRMWARNAIAGTKRGTQ
jgi:hypothetical protein